MRNFVVTENGSRFKTGLESAFDTPESFTNVWKIWPPKNDYVHKVEDGVCRIELHPWRLGKKDPDYHFYTRDYTFRRRARYELSFEAKGEKGATWIRPSCYAVAPDGVHSAIPLGDESMDPLYASAAKAQDAGVNFVSYGIPEVWKENGLDFSAFDEITDRLIAVNPHVLLIPRVSVNAPRWWLKKNPDHRMVFADDPKAVGQWSGTAVRPDMAAVSSRAYRKIANEYIAAFCRHMMAKYPQNFAGIHPTGQNTHEWFYFDSLRIALRYPFKVAPDFPQHSDIQHMSKLVNDYVRRQYDYVVCLVDMDRLLTHPSEMETYKRLKSKSDSSVMWVETNPCTEFWFLLHFLPGLAIRHYTNQDQAIAELRKYMPGYEKTQRYLAKANIYCYLRDNGNLTRAMANAEQLCKLCRDNKDDRMAYSEVHKVLKLLEEISN